MKRRTKIFLGLLLCVFAISIVSATMEITNQYIKLNGKTSYLPYTPYNAIVYQSGSNYIVERYDGAQLYTTDNKTLAIEQAILQTKTGVIYLRNVSTPYPSQVLEDALELYSEATVISDYNGIISYYADYGHTPYNDVEKVIMRFYNINASNTSKAILEWRDAQNRRVGWIAAHDWLGEEAQHQHISIEAADENYNLYSRFEVTYGTNKSSSWVYIPGGEKGAYFGVADGLFFRKTDKGTKVWSIAPNIINLTTNSLTRLSVTNDEIIVWKRLVPSDNNTMSLGYGDKWFKDGRIANDLFVLRNATIGNITATNYYSGDGTQGWTGTINVNGTEGACALTVKNGLITGTDCP